MNLRLSIPNAPRVLDFGCGSGRVIAGSEVQGNPVLVGVDLSVDKLREGKSHGSLQLVAANGLSLPFASESFDVVIGHVSMPYMNTRRALEEIYRVLTPGGTLFLTFHCFRYCRQRALQSFRQRRWKDVFFMSYVALNGVLNHLALPQLAWLKGRLFETVNTRRGVRRTAESGGFVSISPENGGKRIFFAVTASKPDPTSGVVLPHCGWSICDQS
jgi:SAM-dependent methyltransferase